MTDRSVAVASYNIHGCVGVDGRYDPGRIAEVIRELDAEVVALQEVRRRPRAGHPDFQLEQLGGETGYTCVAGPNLHHEDGDYGNGLLTVHPVRAVRRIDLCVPGLEPRGAMDVDLDVRGRRLRMVVAHLGLRAWERRIQVGRLLAALAPLDAEGCPPFVLAGDLNEWAPWSATLRVLRGRVGPGTGWRTFPSTRPLFALDRIFAPPGGRVADSRVLATPLARRASDHLPVRASVGWDEAPA